MNEFDFFLQSFLSSFSLSPEFIQSQMNYYQQTGQLPSPQLLRQFLSKENPPDRVEYIASLYERELAKYQSSSYGYYPQPQNNNVPLLQKELGDLSKELLQVKEKNAQRERELLQQQMADVKAQAQQQIIEVKAQSQQQIAELKATIAQAQQNQQTPAPLILPSEHGPDYSKYYSDLLDAIMKKKKASTSESSPPPQTTQPTPSQPIIAPEPPEPKIRIDWQDYIGADVEKKGIGETWDDAWLNDLIQNGFTKDYVEHEAIRRGCYKPTQKIKDENEE